MKGNEQVPGRTYPGDKFSRGDKRSGVKVRQQGTTQVAGGGQARSLAQLLAESCLIGVATTQADFFYFFSTIKISITNKKPYTSKINRKDPGCT